MSGFLPPAKARSGDGNAVGDMRMVLQLLEESGKEGLQSAKLTRSGSSHKKLVGFTYLKIVIFRYVNIYQRVMGNFPLWDETGIPSSWMMIVNN